MQHYIIHSCVSVAKQAKIPISDVLLEDLILALDVDLNNRLDYRELAKGMGLWKVEKRDFKKQVVGGTSFTASPSESALKVLAVYSAARSLVVAIYVLAASQCI